MIEVSHIPSAEAVNWAPSVTEVYASVYSCAPYHESPEQIQNFKDSWPTRVKADGFVLVGARCPKNGLVGIAYGWMSKTGDPWNTKLREALGSQAEEWLSHCFEFVDWAVKPDFHGHGLGRKITEQLFQNVSAQTAILLTHQTITTASESYLRNGWSLLKENFEIAPGKIFRIMGKKLRGST